MKYTRILKSVSLLAIVGSISACGGASVSDIDKALPGVDAETISTFDTNNDGMIDQSELPNFWSSLSANDKIAAANAINAATGQSFTVADINEMVANNDFSAITTTVNISIEAVKGDKGDPGTNGVDGKDGADGADGKDGEDGVGVSTAIINDNGELVVTLTDGSTINVGVVVGSDGADGQDGADGADGKDGADGQDGADGADGKTVTGITSEHDGRKITVTYNDGTTNTFLQGREVTGTADTTTVIADERVAAKSLVEYLGESWLTFQGTDTTIWSNNSADNLTSYFKSLRSSNQLTGTDEEIAYWVGLLDQNNDGVSTVQEQINAVSLAANISANLATNEKMYETVNVNGLKAAHDAGWTGKGVDILVFDESLHGIETAGTAKVVAPGATVTGFDMNTGNVVIDGVVQPWTDPINDPGYTLLPLKSYEVVNLSYESINIDNEWSPINSYVGSIAPGFGEALKVISGPNTGVCGLKGVSADGKTASECDIDGLQVSLGLNNMDDSTWIFVGALDDEYTSMPVGDEEALQDNWIVADGKGIGGSYGTSFAAPKVSGAAALVIHKFGTDAATTKEILLETADDTFAGYARNKHGHGMLDVAEALSPIGDID